MKGIYFNGRRYIRPQAMSRIDDSGMYGRGLGGGNTLALIGESTGGEPKQVLWFTDPSYAKSIFRSGPLLTAIQRAYDPSVNGGAYLVAAIRVNPAGASSLTLKSTISTPLILLSSVDYGLWNNQIKARIESGSTQGKKVTITYGTSYDQGDNIYKNSLFVALADAQASLATIVVDTMGAEEVQISITSNAQYIYYNDNGSPILWSGTSPAYSTGLVHDQDHIYIGSDIKFNTLKWDLGAGVANDVTTNLVGEYWNGAGWISLPNFTDGSKYGGKPFSASTGDITFYGTGGEVHSYPPDWIKSTYNTHEMYWVRISAEASLLASARSVAGGLTLHRDFAASLETFTTIQQLVDYLDSLPGIEAGVLTSSPTVDLSENLDDLASGNLLAVATYVGAGGYDPSTNGRSLSVADASSFVIGDYIVVSRMDGTAEETRRITALPTSQSMTIDSVLSTTYSQYAKVRKAVILNSDLQAVIGWLNANSAYVTAVAHDDIEDRGQLAAIPDTYLTGGTEGAITQQDWDDCLDLLKTEDTPLITCVSYEPSVWASLSSHVTYMSTIGKKERRGFCGGFSAEGGTYLGGLGLWNNAQKIEDSIATMLQYALDLNSDRMYYVGPGFVSYDENGNKVTFNGAISAALAAGLASAVDVAEPLTHKSIKTLGLEYNFKWADLDRLLLGGVFPLEYDPGVGYRVCQSISTWLVNDNYYRRELSTGRVGDFVARQVRDRLEQDFVGRKGTSTTLISIKNATISVLTAAAREELLAGDVDNPPFKNIQVRLVGDACYVEFECSPVIPINYIPITIHLTVFTATLTA